MAPGACYASRTFRGLPDPDSADQNDHLAPAAAPAPPYGVRTPPTFPTQNWWAKQGTLPYTPSAAWHFVRAPTATACIGPSTSRTSRHSLRSTWQPSSRFGASWSTLRCSSQFAQDGHRFPRAWPLGSPGALDMRSNNRCAKNLTHEPERASFEALPPQARAEEEVSLLGHGEHTKARTHVPSSGPCTWVSSSQPRLAPQ